MNVGLPTTGLGGIFYILSGLLMPFIELIYTFREKSSTARWKVVFRQVGITMGILALIWITSLVLKIFIPNQASNLIPVETNAIYSISYIRIVLASPILALGTILGISWIASLFLRKRPAK
ncbi:MAG: hypothetical protein AAB443_03685 [Patescibacteria group bacterium]